MRNTVLFFIAATALLLFYRMHKAYADNQALFNSAMQVGSQNQFNMNLNPNSTIDSYGQQNKLDPSVAANANAGNAPAKEMYSHISGKNLDNNYLYNAGTAAIQDCLKEHDPRCSTLNKYGDKDTQTQYQAYAQGISSKYQMKVMPDPNNSVCSLVTRKEAINSRTEMCIAGMHAQNMCSTTLMPYANYVPPSPPDGSVIGQASNQNTEKTYCAVAVSVIATEALTKSSQVLLKLTNTDLDNPSWTINKSSTYSMSGGSNEFLHLDDNNGSTHKQIFGRILSGSCNGGSCSITVQTECSHGQLGGNDWNRKVNATAYYKKQTLGYTDSGVVFTDNCSKYK